MKVEQWHRVKSVFVAAIELPESERAAFLRSETSGDEALCLDLESLLRADAEDDCAVDRLIDARPALLAEAFVHGHLFQELAARPRLEAGTIVGGYEVTGILGSGGMGDVYRARDGTLNRDVALKLLPDACATDPDRLARFRREAQTVAALNHPNIGAIYEFVEFSNGSGHLTGQGLVLELVDGPTLADRIAQGPLPLDEALTIARQIADALSTAHEHCIIHCDLKPSNIKITAGGLVKLLDFGVARSAALAAGAPRDFFRVDAPPQTTTIFGTPAYMSPEQSHGRVIDARTDVWAFGCVLFEMLSAVRPFAAEDVAATIAATAGREPEWKTLPSATPAPLVALLQRCLEKDESHRAASIAEVRRAIDELLVRRTKAPVHFGIRVAIVATAALLMGGTAVLIPRTRATPSADRSRWTQLTNMDAVARPALSRDGRTLAFIRGPELGSGASNGEIYVQTLPGGPPVQLTHDALAKADLAFSPSGDHVAYTVSGGGRWDTWVVSIDSPKPRPWLRNASGLSWLGADRLLFSEVRTGSHMAIVTADTQRSRSRDVYMPQPVNAMAHRSQVSPDGRWAVVVEMDERGAWRPCRVVPVDGSASGQVLEPARARCTSAAWSPDGEWIYFTANAGDGSHLWRQRFPSGRAEQVTSGSTTEEEGVAVAPDGQSLVTAVGRTQRSVWVRDPSGERQISVNGFAYYPLLSTDGRLVCYRVTPTFGTGQMPSELWMADVSTGRAQRLLDGMLVTGYDLWDGQVVASVRHEDGTSRLWVAPVDGRALPRVIPGAEGDNPRFTRSGDVLFRSVSGNRGVLWRVRQDGTLPREVGETSAGTFGIVSPDGRWISGNGANHDWISARSIVDETVVPIIRGIGRLRWSPDGAHVYISLQYGDTSAFAYGRTYVLPVLPGSSLPAAPPGGFQSEADLAAFPGVQILPHGDLDPGPTPGVYAFSRTATTRNIYRIPLP